MGGTQSSVHFWQVFHYHTIEVFRPLPSPFLLSYCVPILSLYNPHPQPWPFTTTHLRSRCTESLHRPFRVFCPGIEPPSDPFMPLSVECLWDPCCVWQWSFFLIVDYYLICTFLCLPTHQLRVVYTFWHLWVTFLNICTWGFVWIVSVLFCAGHSKMNFRLSAAGRSSFWWTKYSWFSKASFYCYIEITSSKLISMYQNLLLGVV